MYKKIAPCHISVIQFFQLKNFRAKCNFSKWSELYNEMYKCYYELEWDCLAGCGQLLRKWVFFFNKTGKAKKLLKNCLPLWHGIYILFWFSLLVLREGYMNLHSTFTLVVELFPLGMGHCRPLCCWPLQLPHWFRLSPPPPLIGPAVEPWGRAGREWRESHCHHFLPPSPSRQPLWLTQAVMWSKLNFVNWNLLFSWKKNWVSFF